jgi:RsiW-degrading membrane proteinase PrsW (M82 family)
MNLVLALVPVLAFLLALQMMDSFKLVRPASVLAAIAAGAAAALACIPLHGFVLRATALDTTTFSRYVAPFTAETLKAAFVVFLFAGRRVGFNVDAAVQGFAVGTGFALVENVDYLRALGNAPTHLWLVRGLGTAMLHGATTALFAMISRTVFERRPSQLWLVFWPGWATAVVTHSAFNHVLLPPLMTTALLMTALPLLLMAVFQRSEQATREWVGAGLDLDVELLQLVQSDTFWFTRFGLYLQQLRQTFPGPIVADMFCLLRLELEVAVQAKAMLMAREAGLDVSVDEDLGTALAEIDYLQASIGKTGMLALKPLMVSSHRDDWHQFLLAQTAPQTRLLATFRSRRLRGLAQRLTNPRG